MSYEGKMLEDLNMPSRRDVEKGLLISLYKHKGVIKEFGSREYIVDEIANDFGLNEQQRNAYLETYYKKESRIKRSSLWHRLLFRAADNLAKEKLVSRPTQTFLLTKNREWMLTEEGFDKSLRLLNIPKEQKNILPVKSFEVQKIVKKLSEAPRPKDYNPFDEQKKTSVINKEISIRNRGFRQAVIEAYEYKCAVCKMKITSPNKMIWEVEAAHIVPYNLRGKDDILNGISLCRLHHWAFDVGWFTLHDDYSINVSSAISELPSDFGKIGDYEFIKAMSTNIFKLSLPLRKEIHPHLNAIRWHRENVFNRK